MERWSVFGAKESDIRQQDVLPTLNFQLRQQEVQIEGSSRWRDESSEVSRDNKKESAVGRLYAAFDFWKNVLKANDFVLDIVKFGYAIPFVTLPTPCFFKNNASSLNEQEFVRREIESLLSKGYVEEIVNPAYCCNPLTVVKGKKLRLVLDLSRHVNKCVQYCPVKYENWDLLEQVVESSDYCINWDFVAGYHHVAILPEHRKYLGFAFNWGEVTRYFKFCQLPFGLSSACYVFTKLNRPFIKIWRNMGIRAFMYIDDGVGVFSSYQEGRRIAPIMKSHLQQSGFLINEDKSNWEPSQSLAWLGFLFDFSNMTLSVSVIKMQKVIDLCGTLLKVQKVSPRQIAKVVGMIIAMQKAIGQEARFMTRYLTFWINDMLQEQYFFEPKKIFWL